MPKMRTVVRRPAVSARKPQAIPEPGPVTPGKPLAEVQAETEKVIGEFVRQRRTKHGRVKLVQDATGRGQEHGRREGHPEARVCSAHPGEHEGKGQRGRGGRPVDSAVEGRNAQNCQNIDVVNAARKKGHDVSQLVCRQCPYITTCRTQWEVLPPV